MELYIGGFAQGKTAYVRARIKEQERPVINHLHEWFRELLRDHKEPEKVILDYCLQHPDCILISDEVGCGVVPMDPGEREYRERLGRLLTELAQRAERVERIICGMGQRLK